MYACKTWPTNEVDENRLAIMERKFLRKIYGPKRNKDQTYEIRSNKELQELFGKPDIIAEICHKRLSWLGHVLRAKSIVNAVLIYRFLREKGQLEDRNRDGWTKIKNS